MPSITLVPAADPAMPASASGVAAGMLMPGSVAAGMFMPGSAAPEGAPAAPTGLPTAPVPADGAPPGPGGEPTVGAGMPASSTETTRLQLHSASASRPAK